MTPSKKTTSDKDSLFSDSKGTQTFLFNKEKIDSGEKQSISYIPMGFQDEMKILKDYIQTFEQKKQKINQNESLLFYLYTKLEKLQDIRSQEFWEFCDGLEDVGEKIKKTLKLKEPKPKKKILNEQISLEEILSNQKNS